MKDYKSTVLLRQIGILLSMIVLSILMAYWRGQPLFMAIGPLVYFLWGASNNGLTAFGIEDNTFKVRYIDLWLAEYHLEWTLDELAVAVVNEQIKFKVDKSFLEIKDHGTVHRLSFMNRGMLQEVDAVIDEIDAYCFPENDNLT